MRVGARHPAIASAAASGASDLDAARMRFARGCLNFEPPALPCAP